MAPLAVPPTAGSRPRLAARSRRRARGLPHIQHGLLVVIQPDFQPRFGHPHPGKPMGRTPKALLRAPVQVGGQLSPTRPFDDLLIKSLIEVGLVMVVPSKVDVNVALPDHVFEGQPDKPGPTV